MSSSAHGTEGVWCLVLRVLRGCGVWYVLMVV